MSNGRLEVVIEEISAIVMMAEASDLRTLGRIRALLVELQALAAGASSGAAVLRCLGLVDGILENRSEHSAADLDLLREEVSGLQAGPSSDSAADQTDKAALVLKPAAGQPGPALVLPPWVDEAIFFDFVNAQFAAVEELQEDILKLEKGETGRLAALRRRMHSMKGEAGVVGLTDLCQLCHAVESFLATPLKVSTQIEHLLLTADWLESALGSYLQKRLPSTPAAEIESRLRRAKERSTTPPDVAPPVVAPPVVAPPVVAPPVVAPPAVAPPVAAATEAASNAAPRQWDDETILLLGAFIDEGLEGLALADQSLLNIESEGPSEESINSLFRVFHNIKGVSSFYNIPDITSVAHKSETVLSLAREGTLDLRGALLDAIFDSTQLLRQLIDKLRAAIEQQAEPEPTLELKPLLDKLQHVIEGHELPEQPMPVIASGMRLGEILENTSQVAPEQTAAAVAASRVSGRPIGEELIALGAVAPKQVAHALRAQRRSTPGAPAIKDTLKVDVDRVDALVEMIGELLIVQSMIVGTPEVQAITSPQARNYFNQLTKITKDLQRAGMQIRMLPVRGAFQKMTRMVRDLSKKCGKEVRLILSGEGTEMDRAMVEQIGDPLVHIIRNAVDHGIESAEERRRAEKPALASVHLSAYHEGGSIAIEIRDDGRGLDRAAILAKARAQGLIKEGAELSESDIYDLILLPGFSTAKQVTEVSGRGVGMDVVKRNIEALHGRVQISTTPGKGTTFKLVLPLTLAIIDGMLVACGDERYVIPTLSIVESIRPDSSMVFSTANRGEVINLRGEILPMIRLGQLFDIPTAISDPTEALIVVIETGGTRFGLVVDNVIQQQQVVIKSLGAALTTTKLVSGAAILSDGHVGFIINAEEIGRLFTERRFRAAARQAAAGDGAQEPKLAHGS